jgi:hypothetical protein
MFQALRDKERSGSMIGWLGFSSLAPPPGCGHVILITREAENVIQVNKDHGARKDMTILSSHFTKALFSAPVLNLIQE